MKLPSGKAFDGLMLLREMALIPATQTRTPTQQAALDWLNDLRETYDRTVGLPPPKDCEHCYFPRHDCLHGPKGRVCELYEVTAQPNQQPAELFVSALCQPPAECPFRHGYSAIVGPITTEAP